MTAKPIKPIEMPDDLKRIGYSLHTGDKKDKDLRGTYWWCYSDPAGSPDTESCEALYINPQNAITDAYDDLVGRFGDQARNFFGLDPSFQYTDDDIRQHVLEMFRCQWRDVEAVALLCEVDSIIEQTDPQYAQEHDLPHLSGADVVQCLCELQARIKAVLD